MVDIGSFVEGLKSLPRFMAEAVYDYLKDHPVKPESLGPYLLFSSAGYTRNLIYKNDLFELLALCWEPGQVSRIHNHKDQLCWMAVPIGTLAVQNYRVMEKDAARKTCRLEPSERYLITPGAPAAVDENEPVHQVLNLTEPRERAVSLHVYSKPFDTCEIYSPQNGTYSEASLHYTSEYGKRL